jgi:hypothetical protein
MTRTISRPLALITVGDASPEIKKIVDFFKSPAFFSTPQAQIKRRGRVRLPG